jgi:hypothetical protein
MEEVRPNNLVVGEDYYIQMVGRYKNEHHQSGRAIGRGFIQTITFGEIIQQQGYDAINCGIHPDCFNFPDIFVQFSKVEPVNPGARACGICDYQFYPATPANFDTLNNERKARACGGYKFFKMNKKELIKRVATQAMDKGRPGIADQASDDVSLHRDVQSYVSSFMGGKKRRRKSRRKTRRKTRKTKRKSRKRRRKRKTKKRR